MTNGLLRAIRVATVTIVGAVLLVGTGQAIAVSAAPAPGPVVLSDTAVGVTRIAVRLAAGAHFRANGRDLPNDQRHVPRAGGDGLVSDDEVSELVTRDGRRLDLSAHHLRQDSAIGPLSVHVFEVPSGSSVASVLAALRADSAVLSAEETQPVYAMAVPNDPYYSYEWAAPKIGLPTAWNTTTGSSSVTVAVVDTGLDGANADFAGRIVKPYDVTTGSSSSANWLDAAGHGTAVAGVAASQGNNGTGIAGVAWNVKLMPVKISQLGSSDDVTLAAGIVYAVDNGANVINVSFGGDQSTLTMASAVNYALSKGVVVVASAGNSGVGAGVSYPAAYPGVISVGATDSMDRAASFSSTGAGLILSAPGVNIYTWNATAGSGALKYWSGTSFSSPMVAGVAALMLSANSSLTPAQVAGILQQTALDLGTAGQDSVFGYGRVRADAAVAAAAAGSTTPTTTPSTLPPSGTTPTRYQQTDTRLAYSGSWSTLNSTSYSGGSLKNTSNTGASVTVAFNGTSLTWIARIGTPYGKAQVTVDGGTPTTVDLYSASIVNQKAVYTTGTLSNGPHTVTIAYTGQKNPLSNYAYISIDAVDVVGTLTTVGSPVTTTTSSTTTTSTTTSTTEVTTTTTSSSSTTTSSTSTTLSVSPPTGPTRYQQTDTRLAYSGSWSTLNSTSYSGGSLKNTSNTGASVTVAFNGTSLTWIARIGTPYGKAQVTVDGGTPTTVDLYSASIVNQKAVYTTGTLSNGPHTVTIAYTGQKNPLSNYAYISIDAVDVVGTLTTVGSLGVGVQIP